MVLDSRKLAKTAYLSAILKTGLFRRGGKSVGKRGDLQSRKTARGERGGFRGGRKEKAVGEKTGFRAGRKKPVHRKVLPFFRTSMHFLA